MNRELAEAALLRRVDSFTAAQLVGRRGGDYSGIAIPYFSPGSPYVREYRLRRDHPDFEAGANGGASQAEILEPAKPREYVVSPARV